MKAVTVLLDANILYSAPLRDFFIHLGILSDVRLRWSERIQDEWMRNLLLNRPDISPSRVKRTSEQMNAAVPEALVKDFEDIELHLKLPDVDDRHVLAAAIHCQAQNIITKNLSDFPSDTLAPYGIEALHPDEFVQRLLEDDPRAIIETIQAIQRALVNPPKTIPQILETLEQQELPMTTKWLRRVLDSNEDPHH